MTLTDTQKKYLLYGGAAGLVILAVYFLARRGKANLSPGTDEPQTDMTQQPLEVIGGIYYNRGAEGIDMISSHAGVDTCNCPSNLCGCGNTSEVLASQAQLVQEMNKTLKDYATKYYDEILSAVPPWITAIVGNPSGGLEG